MNAQKRSSVDWSQVAAYGCTNFTVLIVLIQQKNEIKVGLQFCSYN